jgi:hypothetical protein
LAIVTNHEIAYELSQINISEIKRISIIAVSLNLVYYKTSEIPTKNIIISILLIMNTNFAYIPKPPILPANLAPMNSAGNNFTAVNVDPNILRQAFSGDYFNRQWGTPAPQKKQKKGFFS